MTQTWAIFYDAYRSLNAKKMFWVVLWLSGLVAAAFACVGINQRGLKILVWQFDTPPLSTKEVAPAVFYKLIFAEFGISVWLAWLASILALISTAGIFPDLLNSGSIHLLISKPIGRLRLFFTQYAGGLLFVTLQVTLFTLACFLVIGLRGGAWEPVLFLAVPVVVCFFSYLFSVCVLVGLATRSTLAALLLTLLFWFLTAVVGGAEVFLLRAQTQGKYDNFPPGAVRVYSPDSQIPPGQAGGNRPAAPQPLSKPGHVPKGPTDEDAAGEQDAGRVPRAIGRALLKAVAGPSTEGEKKALKEAPPAAPTFRPAPKKSPPFPAGKPDASGQKETSAKLKLAYDIVYGLKTVLPKTGETIGLLERSLYRLADIPSGALGQPQRRQVAEREVIETIRKRSPWWVVGTSLGFEAVVLCCAAWIFYRRDY
jgi:ABC-type transport system involved in multi-copper enzyme maturation permease subunit